MRIVHIDIPNNGDNLFNLNFKDEVVNMNGLDVPIHSTGTSWNYPSQIKGWLDWDVPTQAKGKFRDVDTFSYNKEDLLVATVRNPFNLLFEYFKLDWAWCRKHHSIPKKEDMRAEFSKFVDIYLDRSLVFHAPPFRTSLFSQLKDIDGNWLMDGTSIILKYESLIADIDNFSNFSGITVNHNNFKEADNNFDMFTQSQIQQLNILWKDDLEYFGYTSTESIEDAAPQVITPIVTPMELTKKRIAICFSGEIRDLERTKDYWTSMIKEYDMDVYASFWDTTNSVQTDTIENFHRIYDVKKTEMDSYKSFEKSTLSQLRVGINPPNSLQSHLRDSCINFGTLSMWYKIWRANLLTKELDIDYDLVIRVRTDVFLDDKFDITINDMLNIPFGRVKTSDWKDSDGICDLLAYGSPKLMDYYSSCIFYMMEHLNKGYYMVPHEYFLHTHLNKTKIPIRFMGTNLTITRTSKNSPDEIYCKGTEVVEEVLPANFMELQPNPNLQWKDKITNI